MIDGLGLIFVTIEWPTQLIRRSLAATGCRDEPRRRQKARLAGQRGRNGLHHALVAKTSPRRVAGRLPGERRRGRQGRRSSSPTVWSPPFGGGTHNCCPSPTEICSSSSTRRYWTTGGRHQADLGVRQPGHANPISIATFPMPSGRTSRRRWHFGPHNIHENRPGSFQSSGLIFATYQNAGVRLTISPIRTARSKAALVPPPPNKMVDPRRTARRDPFRRRVCRQQRRELLDRLERRRSLYHGIPG